AGRAPSAVPDGGARPAWQGNTVVIYRGSSVDDGAHGGGIGTPGLPPLPAGLPGLPGGGTVAADAAAQPRAAAPQ
ncbi:Flp pilus assembly protein CpaB, partial [Burkholderia pseudomallei]|nr:Flp pilus assembly protein CpaB [Burkholderia pseudomallei]